MARSRSYSTSTSSALKDLFTTHFHPPFSPRRLSFKRFCRVRDRDRERYSAIDQLHVSSSPSSPTSNSKGDPVDALGDSAPPEWAFLLIGCLLGLASGLLVAAFKNGVSQAMSKNYVKLSLATTLKEVTKFMHDNQQNCVMVVNNEDFLEGILTYGDVRRYLSKKSSDVSNSDLRSLDDTTFLFHPFALKGLAIKGRSVGF